MITCRSIEAALKEIHTMDRPRCIHELTHFRDIPLDFDPDFLNGMSIERLRHILMAAVLTRHRT